MYIAATLFIYTWTIQTSPGAERSSMIHAVTALGLGTGFAVGGVRYADAGYKSLAWFVLSLYALLIAGLVGASIIPKDRLIEFWRSVGIR
jgi:predicted MFS family arabinose efflux permease